MIEVVFGRSAAGSLKQAGSYGRGKFRGAVGLVYGGSSTPEERATAQKKAEERAQRDWEKAVPMDVKPGDVYGLELGLSMGDIAPERFMEGRRELWLAQYVFAPREAEAWLRDWEQALTENLDGILSRAGAGESLRIWYSSSSEELCGLYWLLARLGDVPCQISLVKLPPWEENEKGEIVVKRGWGEVAPGEWGRYVSLTRPVNPAFRRACARKWEDLQRENSPLRAMVNGGLMSVEEDFYDSFIRREIGRQEDVFQETDVIIALLTRRDLGIGDGWIHLRIEEMVRRGELEALTVAEKDCPAYRRKLRKLH